MSSIEEYIGEGRIDYVVFNSKEPKQELVEYYEQKEGKGSLVRLEKMDSPKRAYRLVKARIVSSIAPKISKADAIADARAFIRHDPDKLAKTIMLVLELNGGRVIEDIE